VEVVISEQRCEACRGSWVGMCCVMLAVNNPCYYVSPCAVSDVMQWNAIICKKTVGSVVFFLCASL